MDLRDRRLGKELAIILIVKILAISALWWCFVRDTRVVVDSTSAAHHLGTAPQPQIHPTRQGKIQ